MSGAARPQVSAAIPLNIGLRTPPKNSPIPITNPTVTPAY